MSSLFLKYTLVFLLSWLVSVSCLGSSQFLVNSGTNKIVDQSGRERYFHGANVVYKTDPFIPITDHFDPRHSFSQEDVDLVASMGYNTIRLDYCHFWLNP